MTQSIMEEFSLYEFPKRVHSNVTWRKFTQFLSSGIIQKLHIAWGQGVKDRWFCDDIRFLMRYVIFEWSLNMKTLSLRLKDSRSLKIILKTTNINLGYHFHFSRTIVENHTNFTSKYNSSICIQSMSITLNDR